MRVAAKIDWLVEQPESREKLVICGRRRANNQFRGFMRITTGKERRFVHGRMIGAIEQRLSSYEAISCRNPLIRTGSFFPPGGIISVTPGTPLYRTGAIKSAITYRLLKITLKE